MREILFRGKSPVTKEWIYGDLFQHGEQRFIMTGGHNIEVEPECVGQYTGLTDENDVKIFEGDIVHLYGDKGTSTRFINYIALVIFAHGGFCAIDGTPDDYAVCRFDFTSSLNCEIIGNVYDNPELIEDGDTNEEP